MSKMSEHNFYCIRCGNKGIPLSRNRGHQHGRFHKKKLYCMTCKEEVNHIECKNAEDVEIFKTNFENGVYINEVEESLAYLRSSGFGQINFDEYYRLP